MLPVLYFKVDMKPPFTLEQLNLSRVYEDEPIPLLRSEDLVRNLEKD